MEMIDAHVHLCERITGYALWGESRPVGGGSVITAAGETFQMFDPSFGETGVLVENMIDYMDAHGIDRAVVMQGPAYGYQNDYIAECVRKYPGRLTGAAAFDPCWRWFEKIMDNLLDRLGYRIAKFEMSEFGGLYGYHADNYFQHPNFDILAKRMAELHGTLVFDIGAPGEASYQPERVLQFARDNPGLRVVCCHLLEPHADEEAQLEELLRQMNRDNIWFDLAALPVVTGDTAPDFLWSRRYLKLAKQVVGAKRLIWGSDTPGGLKDFSYEELIRLVADDALFSQQEQEWIFSGNAKDAYTIL